MHAACFFFFDLLVFWDFVGSEPCGQTSRPSDTRAQAVDIDYESLIHFVAVH
jgi:hypothetical protein